MAKIAEDFPLACPACGGDIRLIAFITDPPPLTPARGPRGPPTGWAELVQAHDDRDATQASPDDPDDLPVIDIRGL